MHAMTVSRALLTWIVAMTIGTAVGGQMEKRFVISVPDYGGDQPNLEALDTQTEDMLKASREVVTLLTAQLQGGKLGEAAEVYIVYALGELRTGDPGALTCLVQRINTVSRVPELKTKIARWRTYPAREALVKIGHPASWMIMAIVGSQKFDSAAVDGYASVMAEIDQPKYAALKLRERLATTKDEKARKQYEAVLARVQELASTSE